MFYVYVYIYMYMQRNHVMVYTMVDRDKVYEKEGDGETMLLTYRRAANITSRGVVAEE